MTFSFVIPSYNHWELTHQLLFDICQRCSQVDEVLVVDDGSSEAAVHQGLEWWKSTNLLPLKTLELKENHGFLLASNAGLRLAKGDIITLISNDVRIHKDIVVPIKSAIFDVPKTLAGARLIDWDSGWNTFNGRTFPYLEGFLLAASKSAWEFLGYFDDRYTPNDMEDVDLGAKAKLDDFHFYVLPEGSVTHIGAQTYGYNPEREAITVRNRDKFKQKWIGK